MVKIDNRMDKKQIQIIKEKSLETHIPIIMDDTLEVISRYLKEIKPKRILEIGTAVRLFCNLFFRVFSRRWSNRYNRKRFK